MISLMIAVLYLLISVQLVTWCYDLLVYCGLLRTGLFSIRLFPRNFVPFTITPPPIEEADTDVGTDDTYMETDMETVATDDTYMETDMETVRTVRTDEIHVETEEVDIRTDEEIVEIPFYVETFLGYVPVGYQQFTRRMNRSTGRYDTIDTGRIFIRHTS